MKLSTSILVLVTCLTVSTFFVADVFALSKLGKTIQKELDVNPFLKKQGKNSLLKFPGILFFPLEPCDHKQFF